MNLPYQIYTYYILFIEMPMSRTHKLNKTYTIEVNKTSDSKLVS